MLGCESTGVPNLEVNLPIRYGKKGPGTHLCVGTVHECLIVHVRMHPHLLSLLQAIHGLQSPTEVHKGPSIIRLDLCASSKEVLRITVVLPVLVLVSKVAVQFPIVGVDTNGSREESEVRVPAQ